MEKYQRGYIFLLSFIILLAGVAYSINIKEPVLIPDESLRALVALEMHYTGDYITPKMGGLHYFKKPPVYNWIVASYYQLTGDYSEMGTRIPMLLSLLAFALSIFYFAKKYFDFRTGVLASFIFIVSLRILSYESLYGLIDITYSFIVFLTIIYTWQFAKSKKYLSLFIVTYALTALSFLMKGIPSIAYQGLTLVLVFILNKEFKKLFSWQHILGGILFLSILSSYYYLYYLKNPDQIYVLLNTIFNESAEKSGISFGLWDIIKHAFSFSIEIIYSFIPASFILLFMFHSKSRGYVKSNNFLVFLCLAFLVNLSIYIVSPISYLRYVIPHFALLSIPTAAAYIHLQKYSDSKLLKSINAVFLFAAIIVFLGNFAYAFAPQLDFINNIWLIILTLTVLISIPTIFLFNKKKYRFELFIIALLVVKLGLNWIIIPSRTHHNFIAEMREKSISHGTKMQGKKAIIYNESLGSGEHFYLSSGKRSLILKTKDTIGVEYIIGFYIPLELPNDYIVDEYKIEYFEDPLKIYKIK